MSSAGISILIPTYNMAEHLEALWVSLENCAVLESVREVLFVNDGSQDETERILKSLQTRAPWGSKIRILSLNSNRGRFHARFEGAKSIGSDWILFLDSRVRLQPGFAESLSRARARQCNTVGWVDIDTSRNIFSLYWQRSHEAIFRHHFQHGRETLPINLTVENYDRFLKGTGVFLCRRADFVSVCANLENRDVKSDDTYLMREILKLSPIQIYPRLRIDWQPRGTWRGFLQRLWERGPSFVEYHVFHRCGFFFWTVIAGFMAIIALLVALVFNPTAGVIGGGLALMTIVFSTAALTKKVSEFIRLMPLHVAVVLTFGFGVLRGLWVNANRVFKEWLSAGAALLILTALGYAYLSPGPRLALAGVKNKVMSDGVDSTTLPYLYSVILGFWKHAPRNLLYGAVPGLSLNPPYHFALWSPWIEKWSIIPLAKFFPLEQLSTALGWELVVLNGFLFYLFGRALKWPKSLSLAVGIGFAFNAYTRARAKVHIGLMGVFNLPAIFLALHLLRQPRDRKRTLTASFLFLLAAMAAHYYIVLAAALAPIFLIYFYLGPDVMSNWKGATVRLLVAVLPACLFLLWCLMRPMPAHDIAPQTSVYPLESVKDTSGFHPFMTIFAAHPIDYLAGDTGITTRDWNPLRATITRHILTHLGQGNPHERANGIRWIVLLLFAFAIVALAKKNWRLKLETNTRRDLAFFIAFSVLCFLISLQPVWFGLPLGPSGWINHLVSQFRVPSRAGMFVRFGALTVAGLLIHEWLGKSEFKKRFLLIAPFLVVAEFPPYVAPIPVAPVLPAIAQTPGFNSQRCGLGVYFPYVSGTFEQQYYYYFLQQMRGTNCQILNAVSQTDEDQVFLHHMARLSSTVSLMQFNDPDLRRKLTAFAKCVPLNWIFFDYQAPDAFVESTCQELGWSRVGARFCQNPEPQPSPIPPNPVDCLKLNF